MTFNTFILKFPRIECTFERIHQVAALHNNLAIGHSKRHGLFGVSLAGFNTPDTFTRLSIEHGAAAVAYERISTQGEVLRTARDADIRPDIGFTAVPVSHEGQRVGSCIYLKINVNKAIYVAQRN